MEEYKKILKPSKKTLIVLIILVVLSIAGFVTAETMMQPSKNEKCTSYDTLISLDQDEENKYAKVTIVDMPYEFATKKENSSTERYYFVIDENNYLYIVRLSPKKYQEIEEKYNENKENFKYELKGYLFNTPNELKKLAINEYNEGRTADQKITSSDFKDYFGKTYLDDRITPNSDMATVFIMIAFFTSIFSTVTLVIYINSIIRVKLAIKKYGKEELELELSKDTVQAYPKAKIHLTEKYVMSTINGLHIISYEDILWTYIEKRRQNGVTTAKFIIAATKTGKKYYIASNFNEDILAEIIANIAEKNNEILVGFTSENRKEYNKRRKEFKNQK